MYPTAQVVCEPDLLQWVQGDLARVPLQLQNGDYCEHSEAWWMESCLPDGYENGRLANRLNDVMQCGLMRHKRNILLAWQSSSGLYHDNYSWQHIIWHNSQRRPILAVDHVALCTLFTLEPVCRVQLIGEAIGDEKDTSSPCSPRHPT